MVLTFWLGYCPLSHFPKFLCFATSLIMTFRIPYPVIILIFELLFSISVSIFSFLQALDYHFNSDHHFEMDL